MKVFLHPYSIAAGGALQLEQVAGELQVQLGANSLLLVRCKSD